MTPTESPGKPSQWVFISDPWYYRLLILIASKFAKVISTAAPARLYMDTMHNTNPERQSETLIGPGDPPPFDIVNPDGAAAMLMVCDHASRAFPAGMDILGLNQSDLERHIASDIGAAEVTRRLSQKLDAAAVLAGYSRLLIDVNRQPGDPQSIPEVSDQTVVPGNKNLTEDAQLARVESLFWPYHHAVANALAHLWRRGPAPVFFSVHSFTPSLAGQDRYWDIGVLWNRDQRLAAPLTERLRAVDGLHVGENEPYSGRDVAYTLDLHAGAAGLPNCAVEIRQDLIETSQGAEYWATILGDAFADILTIDNLHRVEHF